MRVETLNLLRYQMRPTLSTREDWLRACLTRVTAGWPVGSDLPENTRISLGFPQKAHGRGAGRVVEHYRPEDSEGGMFEIFVSPTIGDGLEAAKAVATEAARIATGRAPTATEVGALHARARAVIEKMPAYPHSAIKRGTAGKGGDPVDGPVKGPGSRLLKTSCETCGYTARITRRWLRFAVPVCPVKAVHGVMRVEEP
jgi:hypothetical protein